jgi:hypothetical protein
MSEIKAIETRYKGRRFRSRLEARWAIFFDMARIKWEYEFEGYKLNDGTSYLPDFYLPESKTFVEIKPHDKELVDKGLQKCDEFVFSTKKDILLIGGNPSIDEYFTVLLTPCEGKCAEPEKHIHEVVHLWDGKFCQGEKCYSISLIGTDPCKWALTVKRGITCSSEETCYAVNNSKLLIKAYESAISARFEHGENGLR